MLIKNKTSTVGYAIVASVVGSLLLTSHVQAAGPSVNLFPKAVLSEIKITTEAAKNMESGLLPIVEKMSNQKKLYDETSCEGDQSNSSGCADIFQNISETYVEMLDKMSEALPELKTSVRNAELMLQKKLATEIGRKKTANDLQKELLKSDRTTASTRRSPVRSKRRMSSILENNFKRISGAGSASQSMTSTASDIYLDMRDTSVWIERLDAQITRQKAMAELNISMGTLPDGMEQTINEVVTMVMGDAGGIDDETFIDDPTVDPVDEDDEFSM